MKEHIVFVFSLKNDRKTKNRQINSEARSGTRIRTQKEFPDFIFRVVNLNKLIWFQFLNFQVQIQHKLEEVVDSVSTGRGFQIPVKIPKSKKKSRTKNPKNKQKSRHPCVNFPKKSRTLFKNFYFLYYKLHLDLKAATIKPVHT